MLLEVSAPLLVPHPDTDQCADYAIEQAWEHQHQRDLALADRLVEDRQAAAANSNN